MVGMIPFSGEVHGDTTTHSGEIAGDTIDGGCITLITIPSIMVFIADTMLDSIMDIMTIVPSTEEM